MVRHITLTSLALALMLGGAAAKDVERSIVSEEEAGAARQAEEGFEPIGEEAEMDATESTETGGMQREVDEMENSEDEDGCESNAEAAGCPGEMLND